MSVKSVFTIFRQLNISHILFIMACFFIAISISLFRVPNKKLVREQTHLAMRAIGDELLKANNDFRTPVPPIEQIGSATLRLRFNKPIVIDPDTLVTLSVKHFNSRISSRSIVNVLKADTKEIVYSFEINHLTEKEIPCLGRKLPKSLYLLESSFYGQTTIRLRSNVPSLSLAGTSVLFIFFGLALLIKQKAKPKGSNQRELNGIKLDLNFNRILYKDESIELTDKETQILAILFEKAGELISREYLVQEVWAKQGVVTGRSLDMYISRLRKKLKPLPNIQGTVSLSV
ncbi:hypothetical protein FUAX_19470 [Fulvitalea axinellae]|uniref:OmpR/PhoB-type domain-containing protein n=1 Tax=Fulvitalea axinellae TaxID=1182444 RepID=A0AAU9CJK9_9BACT|nr:hypothetical protein FUAX_19470 [Fulvitalea axinellae]